MKKIFILTCIIALILGIWCFVEGRGNRDIYTKHYDLSLIEEEYRNEEYENQFVIYQDKLEVAVKEYMEEGGKKPMTDFFIEKSRYANYLGKVDWAIEILDYFFEYYDNSSVGWNNLAKLYESKGEYNKANEQYFKFINAFGERNVWGSYYYVIKNYMAMDDREKVEEYYEKYKSFRGGNLDSEIEDYLCR